jgi:phosphopantothenoylcysteine decarboxylase/phosphopantothenate--cysteine ligase
MSDSLHNKRILLGVTGGIAVYKTVELLRLLKKGGALVRVVMTEGAKAFVTPLTFQVLSGERVRDTLFDNDAEAAMGHIELARWADMIVIAPASANVIASLSHGFAETLLTTLCLATTAPIYLCPAMNKHMWAHPATRANIALLAKRGVHMIGPESGEQACGDVGLGRMSTPEAILEKISAASKVGKLVGQTVLITAGPTQEAIDPVRYITNHSSGKMGYALASAAQKEGAQVVLVSGPTALEKPEKVSCIDVISANDMLDAVMKAVPKVDIFIACAAVSDFQSVDIAAHKIKKSAEGLTLQLNKTPDILRHVSSLPAPPFIVGFAAETDSLENNAIKKLKEKNCDMVVANQVGQQDIGFNSDENEVSVFTKAGIKNFSKESKSQLGSKLITYIASMYKKGNSNGT